MVKAVALGAILVRGTGSNPVARIFLKPWWESTFVYRFDVVGSSPRPAAFSLFFYQRTSHHQKMDVVGGKKEKLFGTRSERSRAGI